MASVATEKNGNRRILFAASDRKRKTIRLGSVSKKVANSIARKVEHLNTSIITKHAPDDDVARWAADLDSTLYDKLAAVGLVKPRKKADAATLEEFITTYIDKRTDVAEGTLVNLRRAKRELVEYFGKNKPLAEVTEGDADDFRLWLDAKLGDNTVRRMCGRARQFFAAALKHRLIKSNPFGTMKALAVRENKERFYFVSREEAEKVLEACPDSQWRLIFALSRYAGLRCPSEHLALTWGDIDWERGRMTVRSIKTQRYEGKESRVVPIFPELRPHLEAVWDEADEGTENVITRYRDANANLRTQLLRIVKRVGLKPWPKLFQNLRSTRETELAEEYPIHVVCEWLGNSAAVAAKHYLQVTDEHYETANEKAAQNPAQYGAANARSSESQKTKGADIPEEYGTLPKCTSVQVTPTGLEPVLPA